MFDCSYDYCYTNSSFPSLGRNTAGEMETFIHVDTISTGEQAHDIYALETLFNSIRSENEIEKL